jgi:hypothetical protein
MAQDEGHPEHDTVTRWVGGTFDPDGSDLNRTNAVCSGAPSILRIPMSLCRPRGSAPPRHLPVLVRGVTYASTAENPRKKVGRSRR